MCEPFRIKSWADPTLHYELTSLDAFTEIYEPLGFYIASGPQREPTLDDFYTASFAVPVTDETSSIAEADNEPAHVDAHPPTTKRAK